MKRCTKCGRVKVADDFPKRHDARDGRSSWCKACTYAYRLGWIDRNREKHNASHRRWYARNAEKARADRRAYGASHREEQRVYDAARYAADPERGREHNRAWRAANPERHREIQIERRARLADVFVESVDSLVVLERDDGMCGICGEDVDPFGFDIDHVIPIVRGGEHSYANTQVAHRTCNARKGTRLPWDMEEAA